MAGRFEDGLWSLDVTSHHKIPSAGEQRLEHTLIYNQTLRCSYHSGSRHFDWYRCPNHPKASFAHRV